MGTLIDAQFWLGVFAITLINIALSIDNAIVIALVARALPPPQQTPAIVLGTAAVIFARIALTLLMAALLQLPYVRLVGALLLLGIAVKLLLPGVDAPEPAARARHMLAAVATIVLADLAMSVDNVLSVAAAAQGNAAILVAGLVLSIPLVIFCASLLTRLMQRWPAIILLAAAVLGWVAGGMLVTDPVWMEWIRSALPWVHWRVYRWELNLAQIAGALLVVSVGTALARARKPAT